MASQSWGQLVASIPIAGTQYNTYTTTQSMLTTVTATEASSGFVSLPAGFFQRGSLLVIDFLAAISNRVTGPDTFTINIKVGSVTAFTTGAITLTTTAHTNIPLRGHIELSCRTVGNGTLAALMGIAVLTGQMIQQGGTAGADSATLSNTIIMPNTAPAVGTGFDSTVANTLDFQTAQSFSGSGNGFRLDEYRVVSWGNTAF